MGQSSALRAHNHAGGRGRKLLKPSELEQFKTFKQAETLSLCNLLQNGKQLLAANVAVN